ncbi:hypothetical protein AAZX31_03G019200 [Glycine max]|uniref:rRNA biogenesis protein RRP36 n=1 Tax=Glycine max TaxID=3847 RepID=K7KCC4_SOYBN|nr:ribosomal RNA processing protein 36 homolog isoform X1 [Glycine max]KAH1068282.1 hypothetical protein GYH30_006003 [Glycine max]KAH1068285.1 hypothetical protein GYH30_006003 [Glycine max]KRH65225.1 hypothetical protein GLYMA_03G021100v4 [Glycine max]KRH65226.1 hypothetical protein GLYMA_03G021100v4 [Glycine max]|eukprot:XP_006576399.1 ribosomal RNA processing protein 36 homolog isoform X1 [Glycine max]
MTQKQRTRIPDSMETQYEESEKDESSSSYSSSEDEEEEIEKELADVTFEELQKARSNGAHAFFQKPKEDIKLKRANKNRPMEASSKKPVTGFREVIQAPKKVVRDPRFESLCGKLDPDGNCQIMLKDSCSDLYHSAYQEVSRFRKRYNFLYENDLPAERQALKKELKKYKDPKRVNEIEERISWIDKQVKSDSAKHIDAEILAKHKKKEREAAKQGKRPFYLKKSEIRKQRLIEKYNHLKSSGKLEAFVEKRRRRNAAKDHRYMPYRRSGDVE